MKDAAQSAEGQGNAVVEQGVGGRQWRSGPTPEGGGYQDSCIEKNARVGTGLPDPRLAELREIGLGQQWLQLAESIGVDTFLVVWRLLDQQGLDERSVYVPLFNSYLRYQRNRFIQALAEQGLSIEAIQKNVKKTLCEDISPRHIARIISKSKSPLDSGAQ